MFRTASRIASRNGRRMYSTHRQEPPKFRYIALVAVVGTGAFIAAANTLDRKMPKKEISEEEYEQEKKNNRLKYKKSAFNDVKVIIMVGAPGSGRTTQCKKLEADGFVHLCADDLISNELKKSDSKHSEIISRFTSSNRPVPQEIQLGLLHAAMLQNVIKGNNNFVLEGFPASVQESMKFEEDIAASKLTIYLECPEKVLLKRMGESIKPQITHFEQKSVPMVKYFEIAQRAATFSCDQKPDKLYNQIKNEIANRGLV